MRTGQGVVSPPLVTRREDFFSRGGRCRSRPRAHARPVLPETAGERGDTEW